VVVGKLPFCTSTIWPQPSEADDYDLGRGLVSPRSATADVSAWRTTPVARFCRPEDYCRMEPRGIEPRHGWRSSKQRPSADSLRTRPLSAEPQPR